MKKIKFSFAIAGLVVASQLTGCLSIKAYVDPAYKNVSYSDIKRSSQPVPIVLTSEFQRNGVVIPKAAKEL